MSFSIVILAAGQGKRMRSQTPKILHRLAGKTLLEHVTHTAQQLNPAQAPLIVYGHQGDTVRHTLANLNVTWIEQSQQLGTGHALQQALHHLPMDHRVLVLYGDVPLISSTTLQHFIQTTPKEALGIITTHLNDPTGFGRIIREKNHVVAIVEEKDTNELQRAINEINSGIYLFPENFLAKSLPQLQNQNKQQEYYLTDVIHIALKEKTPIHSLTVNRSEEVLGVNDRVQLANLERTYQRQLAEQFMRQGVTIYDPARFDVRGELFIGLDVTIDINFISEGRVVIGDHCIIGPNVILRNVILSDRVEIKANTIIDGAEIATGSLIGPFARIRPGSILGSHVHIGNFVEIKNSIIAQQTKINHLSYIGDSQIGKHVNIGAGTITCNYDGVNKHRTIIGDHAFIGSNTQLVAPLTIGEGATIGAGSTIVSDAPPHQLTLARAKQQTIEHWDRPDKKEK